MRDVFLSYSSADRERARCLVEALEASGRSVWWDREVPVGRNYEEEIQSRLEASRCVVVLWSRTSVKSRWVKAEAQDAADAGRLFPAFLDPVKAPLEYRYLNGVDLTRWDGSAADPELVRLDESLRAMLGQLAVPEAGEAEPPPAHRQTAEARPPESAPATPTATDPGDAPGEITAMRMIANELAEIMDRMSVRRDRRPAPQGGPGEVTLARIIPRRLAQALAGLADSRGRVLPSALALRYLAWSFAVPTAMLLVLHGVAWLLGSAS